MMMVVVVMVMVMGLGVWTVDHHSPDLDYG